MKCKECGIDIVGRRLGALFCCDKHARRNGKRKRRGCNKRPLACMCGKELPKGAKKYCSSDCEQVAYKIRQKKNKRKYKDKERQSLRYKMSKRIHQSLKGNNKGVSWMKLCGYTIKDLKNHLEKRFTEDMTWENYGKFWHIDHIIPQSVFNFSSPEHIDFKRCWDLGNLQPLEATENIKKSNKLLSEFQPSLRI